MNKKNILILVTNNINPYMYDISQILALPKESLYRFRYTERWIREKELLYQPQAGLVVARDYYNAKLYPIRYVTVNKIDQFGFITYIEFLIGNYFLYPSNQKDIDHKISDFNQIISDALGDGYSNIPEADMTPLVFNVDEFCNDNILDSEFSAVEDYNHWSQILQILGRMECYSNFSFLKLVTLKSIAGDEYKCKKLSGGRRGYLIPGGKTFVLDVLQSVPYDHNTAETKKKSYKIELQTEEEVLPRIKSANYVVGCYDLLHFIFKSNVFINDVNSFFEIVDHQEAKIPELLPINMPITVGIGKLRRIMRWLRVIISAPLLAGFVFAESIATWIHCDVNIIRNVLILGLALSAGGFREILAKVPNLGTK